MAIERTIDIDGRPVKFRASAAIPRIYRIKFRRDIFADIMSLQDAVDEKTQGVELNVINLEIFENIAYCMAKHADPANVPETPDEWLEQFDTFSIYEILPQIVDLWGLNQVQTAESKNTNGPRRAK